MPDGELTLPVRPIPLHGLSKTFLEKNLWLVTEKPSGKGDVGP